MRAKINAIAASTWRVCIIAVALVAVFSCSVNAAKAITSIDIANKADRTVICVRGTWPLSMMPFNSTAGHYLGFQFPFTLQAKGRTVGVRGGGISCVKYSNFRVRPAATRIVVNTSVHLQYSSQWSADKKQLTISIWKHGCMPVSTAAVANPVVSVAPAAALVEPVLVQAVAAEQAKPAASADVATPRVRLTNQATASKALSNLGPDPKAAYKMAAAQPEVTTKVLGMVETTSSKPAQLRVARAIGLPKAAPAPVKIEQPMVAKASAIEPAPAAEPTVSVDFLGADINDVLKALSVQSGRNIVSNKDVKGQVTVSLSNVSLDEAMDYVAKLSGYTYTKDNGTYLVAPKESLGSMTGQTANEIETEVFALHYAKADDIITILEKMFPELKTSRDKSKSSSGEGDKKDDEAKALQFFAVSAPADTMKVVKRMVDQLETSVRDHMASLRTDVYTVKYSSPRMIAESIMRLVPGVLVDPAPVSGFALSAPPASSTTASSSSASSSSPASSGSTGTSGSTDSAKAKSSDFDGSPCEAITITGPAEQVVRAVELAGRLDIKSPLINVEAKVTSMNKTAEQQLGMTWNWSNILFYEGFTDFDKATSTVGAGENLQNTMRSHGQWLRQPFDFGATLDALITNGNAKVLASPNLLCMENTPGTFFVGDEVTYIQRIEVTATGQNIVTDTKQVGVQLRVIGDVSPDGYITLNLHPEVSTLKLGTDKGVTLPVVSRRFTDHIVRVKNGETIAIGGLIRNDEVLDMSKIPVLGDLPFLGKLFQHKSKTSSETEVVMFITAKVVED